MSGCYRLRESKRRRRNALRTYGTFSGDFRPLPTLWRRRYVPVLKSFDYAVIRVVPRVEREEFLNAGVVLFCLERRFLQARVHVQEERLRVLWPQLDIEVVRRHLQAFVKVCQGDAQAGPIALLSQRERFHWVVAPRSTMIQVSSVHSGLCDDPEVALEQLFRQLVEE
ncbi:MAG: DUF3037 domain-containing protein [Acidobacteriaceae bacterium]|nr:DUF3037 domain-containing protein [Acidobacteriaceae bacterium]